MAKTVALLCPLVIHSSDVIMEKWCACTGAEESAVQLARLFSRPLKRPRSPLPPSSSSSSSSPISFLCHGSAPIFAPLHSLSTVLYISHPLFLVEDDRRRSRRKRSQAAEVASAHFSGASVHSRALREESWSSWRKIRGARLRRREARQPGASQPAKQAGRQSATTKRSGQRVDAISLMKREREETLTSSRSLLLRLLTCAVRWRGGGGSGRSSRSSLQGSPSFEDASQ